MSQAANNAVTQDHRVPIETAVTEVDVPLFLIAVLAFSDARKAARQTA